MNALYFGGMIIGNIDDAYRYEEWLSGILRRRIAMFDNPSTFWGRNCGRLITLEQRANFPEEAYYYRPEDPLIVLPDAYLRIHYLKRRYLLKLRRQFMKLIRQGKSF